MKNIIVLFSLLLSFSIAAQTKVSKRVATKSNNFGVTYSLPKTQLIIDVEIIKTTEKAGPYYQYAEKYLGITDIVTEDAVTYELGKVTLINKGIPDQDQSYKVEFKQGTVAPYVFLTEEGLLCTINADYTPPVETELETVRKSGIVKEKVVNISSLSEELLMAGTTSKQAEVAAKQIYRIRESRMNILTGEADNMPPDGDAMKLVIGELDSQEQSLTNLFTGVRNKEMSHHDVSIIPADDLDKKVFFRFSKKMGVLDADDLGGEPVYLTLKATEKAPVLDPKEAAKKAKSMKGVIYNLPGKANIDITLNKRSLFKGEVQITQFGTQESLAPVMLEDKKAPVKVLFYPETGSIKQIIQ